MLPVYMLKGIPDLKFTLMEKNISLNLSLVKMPHSNFKSKATEFEAGVERCSCGQNFECASELELAMKRRMHHRFCSNPPVDFDKISVPKKACTMREQHLNAAEMLSPYYICLIMACVLFILLAGFSSDKHDSRTLFCDHM